MKRTFRLDKLVRNGKFLDMLDQGQEVDQIRLEGKELRAALGRKVLEEAGEIDPEAADFLKEVADTQQALNDLAASRGYTPEDIERRRKTEAARWGSFESGIFVKTVTLDAESHWATYYADHPDRFPQVTGHKE